mgnify:CR=1 FL=1
MTTTFEPTESLAGRVAVITGGTGVTGRDVTPEALAVLGGKEIPGFGELFRWISYRTIGTSTIQSRATLLIASANSLPPCLV